MLHRVNYYYAELPGLARRSMRDYPMTVSLLHIRGNDRIGKIQDAEIILPAEISYVSDIGSQTAPITLTNGENKFNVTFQRTSLQNAINPEYRAGSLE